MVLISLSKSSSKLYGGAVIICGKTTGFQWILPVSNNVGLRGISSKAMRHRIDVPPKPAPFPYKEKKYNFLRAVFDHPTSSRIDENSKIIVIDGPPAAGKAALAKELADELDMAYFEAPSIAKTYINDYGVDLRKFDSMLPEICKSYDENDFLKDPKNIKASQMQLKMFHMRFKQYLEALAHVLNTGQGVVLNRSPYSDFVYLDAMVANGLASRNGKLTYICSQ